MPTILDYNYELYQLTGLDEARDDLLTALKEKAEKEAEYYKQDKLIKPILAAQFDLICLEGVKTTKAELLAYKSIEYLDQVDKATNAKYEAMVANAKTEAVKQRIEALQTLISSEQTLARLK